MIPCDICGKEGHAWFNCQKRASKPADWKPERLTKPAEAKIDLRPGTVPEPVAFISATKGEAFVAVAHDDRVRDLPAASLAKISEAQKRPRGRPKIHPDRKAYKAEHERQRRARIKAEKAGE